MITKAGTYSIRTGAMFEIRALEEWYRMSKSTNFTEFKKALKMEAISGYNLVYGDRYDTIYYLSNAKMPIRNKAYKWSGTLPGNTSQTLWTTYHPLEDLPQLLNPSSGYLFNSNHSPFNASAPVDNLKKENYDPTMGYETFDNNRSKRFMELISQISRLDYQHFKDIKYDLQLPSQLVYASHADTLFLLNPANYPEIADLVNLLNHWDRKATVDSKAATIFAIAYYYVTGELSKGKSEFYRLDKERSVEILTYAKNYLLKNFKTTGVALGEYQKLVRGKKEVPLPGIPDVIASMECEPYKKGMVRGIAG
jgi:acyl-homoserine-lactone acylase